VLLLSFLFGSRDLALYVRQCATQRFNYGWLVVGSPHPQVCPCRSLIEAPGSPDPRWPSLCVWHVSGGRLHRHALAGSPTDLHTVSVGQMYVRLLFYVYKRWAFNDSTVPGPKVEPIVSASAFCLSSHIYVGRHTLALCVLLGFLCWPAICPQMWAVTSSSGSGFHAHGSRWSPLMSPDQYNPSGFDWGPANDLHLKGFPANFRKIHISRIRTVCSGGNKAINRCIMAASPFILLCSRPWQQGHRRGGQS